MGFFSWLFGGSKSAETTVQSISNGIDKAFYTEEEKADAQAIKREWVLEYMKNTMPQGVARRFLAFIVGAIWLICILTYLILLLCSQTQTAELIIKATHENVTVPFEWVMGFYFATWALKGAASIVDKLKKPT